MGAAARETVEQFAKRSMEEVFARNGVALLPTDALHALKPIDISGIIFFSGERLHGALVLGSPAPVIAESCPDYVLEQSGSDAYPDWICELSNQILGQIQRSLAERGISISIGVPLSVSGGVIKPHVIPIRGMTEKGPVELRLELTTPSDFVIPEAGAVQSLASEEDVTLF